VLSQRWPRNAPYIWVPWKFSGLPDYVHGHYSQYFHGLLFRSTLWMFLQNLKSVALPVAEIIGGTQKIWAVPWYAHAPFSEKFLIGFYADRTCKYTPGNRKNASFLSLDRIRRLWNDDRSLGRPQNVEIRFLNDSAPKFRKFAKFFVFVYHVVGWQVSANSRRKFVKNALDFDQPNYSSRIVFSHVGAYLVRFFPTRLCRSGDQDNSSVQKYFLYLQKVYRAYWWDECLESGILLYTLNFATARPIYSFHVRLYIRRHV